MKIETKFSVGDTVWFRILNRSESMVVQVIQIIIRHDDVSVDYYGGAYVIPEARGFATKESLLASGEFDK